MARELVKRFTSIRNKVYLAVLSRPAAHVLPWVGPTVGGLVVSGGASSGSNPTIVAGAVLAGLSVIPIYIREAAARVEMDDDALHDARQDLAASAAMSTFEDAIEIELTDRATRSRYATTRSAELLRQCVRMFDRDDDVRAILYVFDEVGAALVRHAQQGRPDEAGDFKAEDDRMASVKAALEAPEPFNIVQVADKDRTYKNFISLPIRSAERSFGLLSIDSPTPDLFSERDGEALRLVAVSLAFCLAAAERGARNRAMNGGAQSDELSESSPIIEVTPEAGGQR